MSRADQTGADTRGHSHEGRFVPTRWSMVRAAGKRGSPQADEALSKLCQTYWYPLYAYVRRSGHGAEDAQDLTQAFFARLLEKNYIALAAQEKGKFRSFLLTALKRFIITQWTRTHRLKRGGGQKILSLNETNTENRYLAEVADEQTPEKVFERRWAMTLLEQVLNRLQAEFVAVGKAKAFEDMKIFLIEERSEISYGEIAQRLDMTPGALKVAIHRLRQRYAELLRMEIAETVDSPAEVEDEIRHLFAALSG